MLVAALAVPTLPLLHLCNMWSTRQTLAAVTWLAGLRSPWVRCNPSNVGRAVNAASRLLHLQSTTCLARSQLIWLILSLCGLYPVIRVGASAGLGAGRPGHAWVELDGVPVADAMDVAVQHPPFDRPLLEAVSQQLGQGRSQ